MGITPTSGPMYLPITESTSGSYGIIWTWRFTKDLNIENIPVGQWFPNNIRGEIRNKKR
jgi:hypothetical protein